MNLIYEHTKMMIILNIITSSI